MNPLLQRARRLLASRMFTNTGGLALASAASQGLGMVAFLIMAWDYTQADIGSYSVFVSWSSMIIVANLLSYQWSVPNIADGAPYRDLNLLLLVLSVASSVLIDLGFTLAGYPFAHSLAALTLFRSLTLIAEQINVRQQRYRAMILSKLAPYVIFLALVWGLPRAGFTPGVDLIIHAHNIGFCLTGLLYGAVTIPFALRTEPDAPPPSWQALLDIARNESRFSIWVTPAQIFNRMAYELPTILIEAWFSPALAGQFSIAQRVAGVPARTVGGALAQVYHGRLARIVRDKQPGGMATYLKVRNLLAISGVAVFLGALLVAPPLMPLILDKTWTLVPDIIRLTAPLYGVIFFVSPLTSAFFVFEDQRFLFGHQLSYLVVALIAFGIGILMDDLLLGVGLFSLLAIARYVVIYLRVAHLHRAHLQTPAPSEAP